MVWLRGEYRDSAIGQSQFCEVSGCALGSIPGKITEVAMTDEELDAKHRAQFFSDLDRLIGDRAGIDAMAFVVVRDGMNSEAAFSGNQNAAANLAVGLSRIASDQTRCVFMHDWGGEK